MDVHHPAVMSRDTLTSRWRHVDILHKPQITPPPRPPSSLASPSSFILTAHIQHCVQRQQPCPNSTTIRHQTSSSRGATRCHLPKPVWERTIQKCKVLQEIESQTERSASKRLETKRWRPPDRCARWSIGASGARCRRQMEIRFGR